MRKLIPSLLVMLLCTGCVTVGLPQPDCGEMKALERYVSREATPEQMRPAVAQTYGISTESISVDDLPQQRGHLLQWRHHDLWYNMSIQDGKVSRIGVEARAVTADAVIECLGEPTHYSATYGYETEGGTQLDLRLLFAEHGILAGGARILRTRPAAPPQITGDFPISSLTIMEARPARDLLDEAHSVYGTALKQQMLDTYKAWPGKWKEVRVSKYVAPP